MAASCQVERNVELALRQPRRRLNGYPSFAHFIARDREAAIYRKFAHLSARSLLYQQSQLHELERQLFDLDQQDAKCFDNEDSQKVARNWTHYSGDSECAVQHRDLQKKIKIAIKEYRKSASQSIGSLG